MFYFEIVSIKFGWFDVRIINADMDVIITDSYYLGTENPSCFLKALAQLAEINYSETWLLWHNEPTGYIWHFTRINDGVRYTVGG